MRDKLFLTGALRVGKSTCIDRVLCALQCEAGGFRTWFAGPDRDVLMLSDLGRRVPREVSALSTAGVRCVRADVFDSYGTQLLLAAAGAPLMVMDELGRLERDALRFQAQVLSALDGPGPVLGVLRHNAHGWLDAVRTHPRVRVLPVTLENREAVPAEILDALAKLGVR